MLRKESPAEGEKLEIRDDDGSPYGSWVLSWDEEKKTVENADIVFTGTWRYVPAPRLVIVKKMKDSKDEFTAAHGEPVFLFRITGSDSGKSWYRAITFSSEAVREVRKNGSYMDSDGVCFVLRDGYIYGRYAPVYLPEDDYTVEEIDTFRFINTLAESRYHGDEVTVADSAKKAVKVPLRLSEYKPGQDGFGADYISVCFENAKSDWGRLSHTDIIINRLKEAE